MDDIAASSAATDNSDKAAILPVQAEPRALPRVEDHQQETAGVGRSGPLVLTPPEDRPIAEPTEVELLVAKAYSASSNGVEFAAELDRVGLGLARVTEGDVAASKFAPPLVVGQLVAVDRAGVLHVLDPLRPDAEAIEARFAETRPVEMPVAVPSVAEAHAALAVRYAPSLAKRFRDAIHTRLVHIRSQAAAGANGEHRQLASAVTQLADLFAEHLPKDGPADHLRAALAAMAGDRPAEATQALERARTALLEPPGPTGIARAFEAAHRPMGDPRVPEPNRDADQATAALAALAAGDRAACMRLADDLLEKLHE